MSPRPAMGDGPFVGRAAGSRLVAGQIVAILARHLRDHGELCAPVDCGGLRLRSAIGELRVTLRPGRRFVLVSGVAVEVSLAGTTIARCFIAPADPARVLNQIEALGQAIIGHLPTVLPVATPGRLRPRSAGAPALDVPPPDAWRGRTRESAAANEALLPAFLRSHPTNTRLRQVRPLEPEDVEFGVDWRTAHRALPRQIREGLMIELSEVARAKVLRDILVREGFVSAGERIDGLRRELWLTFRETYDRASGEPAADVARIVASL